MGRHFGAKLDIFFESPKKTEKIFKKKCKIVMVRGAGGYIYNVNNNIYRGNGRSCWDERKKAATNGNQAMPEREKVLAFSVGSGRRRYWQRPLPIMAAGGKNNGSGRRLPCLHFAHLFVTLASPKLLAFGNANEKNEFFSLHFAHLFVTLPSKMANLLHLGKKRNKFLCFALDFS